MEKVYVQTASFSRELREDFNRSIQKIAEIGYSGVELFGGIYGGYSAVELKRYFDSLGLEVIGAHVDIDKTTEGELEYLCTVGCRYVICPGLRIKSREEAYRSAELLNKIGEKVKSYGMIYGYHNHHSDFEVYDGEKVIEIFINNTDKNLVTFEIDVGWVWRAGVDAAKFINRYPGRIDLLHIKETSRVLGPEDDIRKMFENVKRDENGYPIITPEMKAILEEHRKINCRLGDGIINVPEIKKVADAQGVKAYIVEREYAYTGDIFSSLAEDYEYLKRL